MDFFAAQARARRLSRWLVAAFLLAVVLVTLAVTAAVVMLIVAAGDLVQFLLDPRATLARYGALVAWVAAAVAATMLGASARKLQALRGGARVIAADLGARRLVPSTAVGAERQLQNVVEELAIAATLPVPAVYLLPGPALNAMVAGYSPRRAALFITEGCLETFDRDELQGVIAHEFSHVVNGDMRLNTRLVGLLHGLFVLSEIGRVLAPTPGEQTDRRRVRLGLAGSLVFAVGFAGFVAGRSLQAAVARERERLADATAVRFARDSRGLRDALVKVAAHRWGSALPYAAVDRVWHMLFASPGRLDFATHPPLHERIRALDPSFTPAEIGPVVRALDARDPAVQARAARSASLPPGADGRVTIPASGLAGLVGNPGPAQLGLAQQLYAARSPDVQAAQRDPAKAAGFVLALAIGDGDRDASVALVRETSGEAYGRATASAFAAVDALPLLERVPAALLLGATLRELPAAERHALLVTVNALLARVGAPGVSGFAMRLFVRSLLETELPAARALRPLTLLAVRGELALLLSVLARQGAPDDGVAAGQAFAAGWRRLGFVVPEALPAPLAWARPLEAALRRIDRLTLRDKERIIDAMAAAAMRDGSVTVAEAELLRLLCAVLRCPLPSLAAASDGIDQPPKTAA